MQLTKTISFDSVIFVENKTVENLWWTKSELWWAKKKASCASATTRIVGSAYRP